MTDGIDEVPCAQSSPPSPKSMLAQVSKSFIEDAERELLNRFAPTAEPSPETNVENIDAGPRIKKYMSDLASSIACGEVPVRSNLAQKMERELSDRDKEEYKKKSSKGKEQFRMQWAKDAMEKCQVKVGKRKIEEWKTVDKTLGRYLSFWAIFREQGGTGEDLQATKNICSKCIQMGHPWIDYNPMSERWDYLYIEKAKSDELNTRCQLFEET